VHAHKLPFNAILSYFLFIIVICLVAFITIFVAIVTCVVFECNVVLVITHNWSLITACQLISSGYDYKAVRRWTTKRKLGYSLIDCDKVKHFWILISGLDLTRV
jgi:hypothetical protein